MNLYNILIIFFGLILMGIYRFNHFPSFNFKKDRTYNIYIYIYILGNVNQLHM